MDGENNGKPYKNGWFGGPTPILETPIFGDLANGQHKDINKIVILL